jgi:hypothetical protein
MAFKKTVKDDTDKFKKAVDQNTLNFLKNASLLHVENAKKNSRVDTGRSRDSKTALINILKKSFRVIAPLFYDIFLERRYGIMKKTQKESRSSTKQILKTELKRNRFTK